MKCEGCIHYEVCIDHKECKHFSPSASWLYSYYPIGTEVYEVRKKWTEVTVYINHRKYKTEVEEYVIENYRWEWVNVACYKEGKLIYTDKDEARKCKDKLNEELKEKNEHNMSHFILHCKM